MGRPAKALIAVTRSVGSNPTLSATTGVLDECVGRRVSAAMSLRAGSRPNDTDVICVTLVLRFDDE